MDVDRALQSPAELDAFIHAWQMGTLPKEAFNHAGHVLVAAWHLTRTSEPEALRDLRQGIQRFNVAVGGQNTADAGYHETATVFWVKKLAAFLGKLDLPPHEKVRQAVQVYGARRDWFAGHYSYDVLASRDARRYWVPPDLSPPEMNP